MNHQIRDAVRTNALCGKPVCLHTSLRSFGLPPPDADAVIDAFLTEGCTVMAPTFSHGLFGVRPPAVLRPQRNGTDYDIDAMNDAGRDRVFDPSTNDIDESIGTLPRVLLQREGRVRGNHPISSFCGIGPEADRLVLGQQPLDVFAPLAALAKADGWIVLIGVGLTRMTLVHLAEKRSGRTLFRRWANGPDGSPAMVEAGSCSEGFGNLDPVLGPVRETVTVGKSTWQLFPAKAALNIATHAIRRNARITHCGQRCDRCDDAVRGGPLLKGGTEAVLA
jgi:aminoglycoside N3'-acetyltransferase